MTSIRFGKLGGDFICKLEYLDLRMLLLQTAACVLNQMEIEADRDGNDPLAGPASILLSRFDWDAVVPIDVSMGTQARLLYEAIPIISESSSFFSEAEEPKLIAEALTRYQEWREVVEIKRRGLSASVNYIADYTNRNERLLAHFEKAEAV